MLQHVAPRPIPTESLETLVRRLLELVGRLTGLESTYLTAIDRDVGLQEILYARNVGSIEIPEGLQVDWADTLCRRALEGGPSCTDDVAGIYPDSAAASELGINTYVTVPVRGPEGEVVGTMCGADARRLRPSDEALEVMEILAEMVAMQLASDAAGRELIRANGALTELAYIDGLTGVGNRRSLDRDLAAACLEASDRGTLVSILTLDIDEFKAINDLHGHEVGDDVLCEVARRLEAHTRSGDIVTRLGGNEFVAALVGASIETAERIARRLCADVGGAPVTTSRGPVPVTLSIGVSGGTALDARTLLQHADTALYVAKAAGRNGVNAYVATP